METNNVSPQKKSSILNTLAIAGFVGIVLLLAWLSIQLVQLFPGAFSSLASLAEGVNLASETMVEDANLQPIIVTSNTSLANSGEAITINWDHKNARGSYVFTYDCLDGVAINQIDGTTERQLACDTNYNVGDVADLTIAIESEKSRFTDVAFRVGFLATNDTKPQTMGSDVVTIVNDSIEGFVVNPVTQEVVVEVVETPVAVTPAAPTPVTPVFEQEFVYAIPTSNPNGFTDLATAYIAVGDIIGSRFVSGPVSVDNAGAIQFSVKNFGTKTSNTWTFSMELPNGGMYNSPTQVALKPNERAVLTIGFPAGGDNPHTFVVKVDESSDRNSGNDSFSQRVSFAR
jgi:hypothetical protein